jgi:large subunit ribosomal protein L21
MRRDGPKGTASQNRTRHAPQGGAFMYAIIKSGSRQYQVKPESVIEVNRLPLEQGADFETDQVLLVDDENGGAHVGAPYVAGAKVKGTVVDHFRGKKVLIFKQKRRKGYRRTRGHRQEMTRLRIDSIDVG